MDDADYWACRALQEARAADAATCDNVRALHRRMAEQLRVRADAVRLGEPRGRPTLRVVTPRG